MAEEVKIVDVAGGPAAEATLQELLKVVKGMATKKGSSGTGEVAATQALYNKSVNDGVKSTKSNTAALAASTKVVNVFAKGLGTATGLLTSALGTVVGIVGNFASALANASNMGELLEAVPIFGSVLNKASGYFQAGADTFRDLSEVGAGFGQNLFELRNAAATAGLSLDQFSQLVSNNSTAMGLLGSTTSEGATRFGRVTKQLRSQEAGLLALGYSVEGLNEGTAAYIELQAAAGQLRNKSDKQLIAGAQNYLTEIDLLSKVTGKSRKELQDEINDRMQAANFNVLASKLSGEALTRFTANTTHTSAMLGKGFGDVMTDLGDGVAQSDFAKILASSVPGLQDLAEANARGELTQAEYQKRLQALMPQITKFADGMGAAGVSQLQNKAGFGEFMDSVAKARTYTQRLADAQAAAAEQARREPITQFMSNFGQTIQNIRSTIENALIDSGVMETLGTILKEVGVVITELAKDLTDSFASFIKTDDVKNSVSSFKTYIQEMGKKAKDFIGYFKTEEFKEKFESFKQGIIKAKDAVVDFIKDISEFGFGGAVAKMLSGGTTTELSTAIGGMVGKALIGLGAALISGIGSLFTSPTALAALVAAIGTLFVLGKAKSAIGGMIGGGSPASSSAKPGATPGGKAGANAGGLLGGLAGGVLEGLGNGLAGVGAKAPLVIAGAAAIGTAIGLIGAGIAGATFLLGKSLPTLSEGLKSFEQLDGGKLVESGKGMAAVAVGMAAFGAGSAVAGLGSLVGSITQGIAGLFGADDPMVKLQKFAEYNIDSDRVKNNAEALVAFSGAMAASGGASAVSGIGAVTGAIGSAIAGFFGSNNGLPYDQILKFASYDFDTAKIKNNAEAMAAFNKALTSSSGAQAAAGGGGAIAAIGNSISKFFGGETPFEQVKAFGDLKLNADGVRNNATAMTAMYSALQQMSGASLKDVEIPKALVSRIKELSDITGGGLPVVAAGMESIAKVQGLQTNLDILNKGLNAQGVNTYTTAMEKLVTTLGDLNKVLAEDNKGMFGRGTGVAASDVVKKGGLGGGASEEQLQKLDQLNTTMVQVLSTLQEGTEYGRRTSKAIRANGNLQLGI
jgi:hypothetical protein